jgi:subtilisin family serine protease
LVTFRFFPFLTTFNQTGDTAEGCTWDDDEDTEDDDQENEYYVMEEAYNVVESDLGTEGKETVELTEDVQAVEENTTVDPVDDTEADEIESLYAPVQDGDQELFGSKLQRTKISFQDSSKGHKKNSILVDGLNYR